MRKSEYLKIWVSKLSEEKAKDILFECIEELITTQSINYYPEDDENTYPYWDSNGDRLGEDN